MNFNVEDVFNVLEDADNSKEVRQFFKEREKLNLDIKTFTLRFKSTSDSLEVSLDVDFADPQEKKKNEDLVVSMELRGSHWKVKKIIEKKLNE